MRVFFKQAFSVVRTPELIATVLIVFGLILDIIFAGEQSITRIAVEKMLVQDSFRDVIIFSSPLMEVVVRSVYILMYGF